MKKLILLCILGIGVTLLKAQAPSQFRYQAVARDAAGMVITGQIDIRFSVLEDDSTGVARYKETQKTLTTPQGVINLTVGKGVIIAGDIETLDWAHHQYWLQVEIKTPAEGNFMALGSSQLLSVPYALYAAHSGDQQNLSAGQGIQLNSGVINNTGDLDATNELQSLSVNGNQLSISNGNVVTLPTGTTYTQGAGININGNSISALDVSPTNEIQTLSLTGQQLSLSNGGGSVQLPAGNTAWSTNGSIIHSIPTTNDVAIGADFNSNAKLNVVSSGAELGGNFTSPGTGDALRAYCNSTGAGIRASSLNGPGAVISSQAGDAGSFSSTSGKAGSFTSTTGTAGYFNATNNGKGLIVEHGYVGIGTTDPDNKLEVANGSFKVVAPNVPNFAFPVVQGGGYGQATAFFGWVAGTGTVANFTGQGGIELLLQDNLNGGKGTGIMMKNTNYSWNQYIDAAKDLNFAYNGELRAWIYDNDGSYHNSSDSRLKRDIKPFQNVLYGLTQLQAYTYHMKDAPDDSPLSIGFMAQDVEKQFPEMVAEKDGFKSLCYDQFAVLSVEAIKEQQQQIDEQQQLNTSQQLLITSQQQQLQTQATEIQDLRDEVGQLKKLMLQIMDKK